jgi:hypothetical protein
VERYTPLAARVWPEGKHFVSGQFFYFGGCSEAAMGGSGGAHSAPLGLLMSPRRRVGAAHGRARVAKTH